jgi:hypothetical protein
MSVHLRSMSLSQAVSATRTDYEGRLEGFVREVVRSVDEEMRGQPAHMVYEMLIATLHRRLPGLDIDQEAMRGIAARISFGLLAP